MTVTPVRTPLFPLAVALISAVLSHMFAVTQLTAQETPDPPRMGMVDIDVTIESSSIDIYVDDELVNPDGASSVTVPMAFGPHALRIECAGFRPIEKDINLTIEILKMNFSADDAAAPKNAGADTESVNVQRQTGSLLLTSHPPGLTARVLNTEVTTTDKVGPIPVGRVDVQIGESSTPVFVYANQSVHVHYDQAEGRFRITYPTAIREIMEEEFAAQFRNSLQTARVENLIAKWNDLQLIRAEPTTLTGVASDAAASAITHFRTGEIANALALSDFIMQVAQDHTDSEQLKQLMEAGSQAIIDRIEAGEFGEESILATRGFQRIFKLNLKSPHLRAVREAVHSGMGEAIGAGNSELESAVAFYASTINSLGPMTESERADMLDRLDQTLSELFRGDTENRFESLRTLAVSQPLYGERLPPKTTAALRRSLRADIQGGQWERIGDQLAYLQPDEVQLADYGLMLQDAIQSDDSLIDIQNRLKQIRTQVPKLIPYCDLAYAKALNRLGRSDEAIAVLDTIVRQHGDTKAARVASADAEHITFWRDFSFANLFLLLCILGAVVLAAYYYLWDATARSTRVDTLKQGGQRHLLHWRSAAVQSLTFKGLLEPQDQRSSMFAFGVINMLICAVGYGLIGDAAFAVDLVIGFCMAALYLLVSFACMLLGSITKLLPPQVDAPRLTGASSVVLLAFWLPAMGWLVAVGWWIAFLIVAVQHQNRTSEQKAALDNGGDEPSTGATEDGDDQSPAKPAA